MGNKTLNSEAIDLSNFDISYVPAHFLEPAIK